MGQAARVFGLAGLLAALCVACGGATGAGVQSARGGGAPSSGERLWRSKCGACHVPVRPGTHERQYVEAALARHRSRVHMSEPAWSSVIDFLSTPPADVATTR
jgi:cytochrome c